MANISTVWLRILRNETPLHLSFAEVAKALLQGEHGIENSYSTPLWMNYDTRHEWLDIVYGVRWVPGMEVNQIWEHCKSDASALFVRYFDEGDDHDRIWQIQDQTYVLDAKQSRDIPVHEKPRSCRYGFDEIRWLGQPAQLGETKVPTGEYQLKLKGSYCSDNPRNALYGKVLVQDFSRIPEMALISWEPNERKHAEPDHIEIENQIRQVAEVYRFYHQNRLVSEVGRTNLWRPHFRPGQLPFAIEEENWLEFHFDGWDNCLDSGYLTAIESLPELNLF